MNRPVADETAAFPELGKRLGERALAVRLEREADAVPRMPGFRLPGRGWLNPRLINALRWSGIAGYARKSAADLQVVHNRVLSRQVPSDLDGFRLLHLSDPHLDLDTGVCEKLSQKLVDLDYDVLVATGDYRDKNRIEEGRWLERFRDLMAQVQRPAYGVLGNHDCASSVAPIEASGMRLLLNERVEVRRGNARLLISGVDDPQVFRSDDLRRTGLTRGDSKTFRILLAHGPALHREAAAWFDLYLCGHTHGGQICLPGGVPLVRNGRCPARMLSGVWPQGGMLGYTSRGVGCCGIPARLFCPPEITLHTLSRAVSRGEMST